ncbi:hypothetical protein BJX65DRAFT_291696 [Aspergillus insuetus]
MRRTGSGKPRYLHEPTLLEDDSPSIKVHKTSSSPKRASRKTQGERSLGLIPAFFQNSHRD